MMYAKKADTTHRLEGRPTTGESTAERIITFTCDQLFV